MSTPNDVANLLLEAAQKEDAAKEARTKAGRLLREMDDEKLGQMFLTMRASGVPVVTTSPPPEPPVVKARTVEAPKPVAESVEDRSAPKAPKQKLIDFKAMGDGCRPHVPKKMLQVLLTGDYTSEEVSRVMDIEAEGSSVRGAMSEAKTDGNLIGAGKEGRLIVYRTRYPQSDNTVRIVRHILSTFERKGWPAALTCEELYEGLTEESKDMNKVRSALTQFPFLFSRVTKGTWSVNPRLVDVYRDEGPTRRRGGTADPFQLALDGYSNTNTTTR